MWRNTGQILAVVAVLAGVYSAGNDAQAFGGEGLLCDQQGARLERRFKIPDQLLRAVSLAESGRWDGQKAEKIAWPWTVTSEGKGHFFPTRTSAIAAVRRLQANGVRNIDVGCMQINLFYHPDAFQNIEQAFDPAANMEYAAKFLTQLFGETKSWSKAVGHYHSRDRVRGKAYRERVVSLWNEARQTAATKRHERQVAAAGGALRPPVSGGLPGAASNINSLVKSVDERAASPSRKPWQDWRQSVSGLMGRVVPKARNTSQTEILNSRAARPATGKTDFAAKRRTQMAAWRKNRVWKR